MTSAIPSNLLVLRNWLLSKLQSYSMYYRPAGGVRYRVTTTSGNGSISGIGPGNSTL